MMGNQQVKPDEQLNYINVEVSSLRYGIRNFKTGIPCETQRIQVQNLARYASEVNSLKRKVKTKNFSRTMENISRTMNEILSIPIQDAVLDSGAMESDSFIDVSHNRRHSKIPTRLPEKMSKLHQNAITKHTPTIKEIDFKFNSLRSQINSAIKNKDSTQLRVLQQTIKLLATDLEMIEVQENTPVGDRKEKLVALLTTFYQKISVALKDIRKSRDTELAVRQKSNDIAFQQLEKIRQELDETDTLLTLAVKEDKPDSVQKYQHNLKKINSKLSSVKTLDDSIMNNKMQMMDKISWLSKYAEDSLETGSRSDLTKAQASYEELIKEIASGNNKNQNVLLTKFDSLSIFVKSISDNDEPTLKHKMQLLNNINAIKYSMAKREEKFSVNSNQEKDSSNIISILKNIEILSDQWKMIEKELKSCAELPETDRMKVVAVLDKLSDSILNIRNELLKMNKIKLGDKLTRSTPNLVTNTPIHKKSISSTSVNNISKLPLKTRAKIYNLEAPKLSQLQRVHYSKKSNIISTSREEDIFSSIGGIKIQVNYIKEKFDQINDENHMKNKLESFKQTLEKYLNNKNETIVDNTKLILVEIQSLMRNLTKLKRFKEIYLFGKIENIQQDIERIRKIVNDYPEMSSYQSFDSIAKQLKCCEVFLTANSEITLENREEMLSRLQSLTKTFEKKSDIKLNLDNLKEKVTRFSGAYRGVLYNKLEKDLNRILVDTSEYVENKNVADEITRETEKQLRILENRASLAQSFRGNPTEISIMRMGDRLNNLKTELEKIRNELRANRSNDVNLFRGLRSRLDLITLDLYQLKNLNDNEEQLKIFIYNDIDTLKSTVDAKIALSEETLGSTLIQEECNKNMKRSEIFDEFETKLIQLKKEIEAFVGTSSDDKFYELDECSLILISKIENLEVPTGTEMHSRKLQTLKDLYEYGKLLDKRAMETENLLQYERDIKTIESNFSYYTKSTKDSEKLAEKINDLKSSLVKDNYNDHLLARKNSCIEKMNSLMCKISTMSQTSENKEVINQSEEFHNLSTHNLNENIKNADKSDSMGMLFLDDERKSNILQEFDSVQKTMQGEELFKILFTQLNEFDSIVNNPVTRNNSALKSELQKFCSDLDKVELSYELKNSLEQKYNDVFDKFKRSIVTNDTYIGSTAFLEDLEHVGTKVILKRVQPISKSLDESEERIERIVADISLFNNSELSNKYHELEDAILQENIFIKKLDIPKHGTLNERKINLKRKIINCLEILDDKVQNLDDFSSIEYQLEELQKNMGDNMTSKTRNELNEKLISLQVNLGQMSVDDKMVDMKLVLDNKIKEFMKRLNCMPSQN